MKSFKYFVALLMFVLAGGIVGCSDSGTDSPTPPGGGKVSAEIELAETGISTATFVLTTKSVDEYAFMTASETGASAPDAAVIFMNGRTGKCADGQNTVVVRDLKADADNVVWFATRSSEGFGDVETFSVHTEGFAEMITVLEHYGLDALRFHIEVPENKTVVYSVYMREDYASFLSYGQTTYDMLLQPLGVLDKSADIAYDGTVPGMDDDPGLLAADDNVLLAPPGTAFVVMAATATFDSAQNKWIPDFDVEGFMDANGGGGGLDPGPLAAAPHGDDTPEWEKDFWTGEHQVVYCNLTRPEESSLELDVKCTRRTTRTAYFEIAPSDPAFDVLFYLFVPLDQEFEELRKEIGEENIQSFITLNGMSVYGDALKETVTLKSTVTMEAGMTYRLYVIGGEGEHAEKQKMVTLDVTPIEPTKPASTIVCTPISAPEGYSDLPNSVWFNVKSPSKDVVSIKYAANRPGEFVKEMNKTTKIWNDETQTYETVKVYDSYAEFVDVNGNELTNVANIAEVNSDAGLNMRFASYADDVTRLAVIAINDEEAISEASVADNRSVQYPAEEPVNSDLFEKLKGPWTLTYTTQSGSVNKIKVDITDGTVDYPETIPEDIYNGPYGGDREAADEAFADFKTAAARFSASVKNRNRLLVEGLNTQPSGQMTSFMSSWDLFCSPNYNCYSVDDIFIDFGPKWYLHIGEGDKVTVPVNGYYTGETPVCSWSTNPFFLFAYEGNNSSFDTDIAGFEVTVSDDCNTLTVNPSVKGGVSYYPTLCQVFESYGMVYPAPAIKTAWVLTRGYDDVATAKMVGRRGTGADIAPAEGNGRYRKTRFGGKTLLLCAPFDIGACKAARIAEFEARR